MVPLQWRVSRAWVEAGVGVILRVPALFLLEAWFRTDPLKAIQVNTLDVEIIVKVVYYLAVVVSLVFATLPLRQLVWLYMYIVSGGLLLASFLLSQEVVEGERARQDVDGSAFWTALLEDRQHCQRLVLNMVAQAVISALIAYLIDMKDWTKFLLLVFALPVFSRITGLPVVVMHVLHNFATIFTLMIGLLYVFNNLGNMIDMFKERINSVAASFRVLGILPVLMAFWHAVLLPVQLLLFWLVLFISQIYVYLYTDGHPILQEHWIIILLASIGECCATPISLFALCVTITYSSYAILSLTKLYLQGFEAFTNDNDSMRGWTEGFTMLLIAVQTDVLDLRPLQRAFLMSILLFIVVSSLIQSMYEIADPVLLALSASHNKSVFKHLRAVALCTFLWMFPLYMTYSICQYFDLDFWLMVIVSSCLLTSVQVVGSLVVYTLFMYDSIRSEPWENLDDIVYLARAVTRVLEFIVAVFVVLYGIKESLFGEWSWINSTILIVHCYFNVWQRLQSGWKSFLLRWEAVKKVESMPLASEEQLAEHDDVCAICYHEMKSAYITPCGHIYHGLCLRKWLYVRESCPMCHRDIVQQDLTPQNTNTENSTANATAAMSTEGQREGANADADQDGSERVDGSECSASTSCTDFSGLTESDTIDQDMDGIEEMDAIEADRM
ncbi:RING finger protein 145-like [Babylonia areolata]|uniref:RING finger protein 145-like n=1 Tax=Babylonia areolata TaxID=304850 RepID=UPI003FD1168B